MPSYLQQVAYSSEGWEALVGKPQNRIEAVRPAIEKLGGKIESAWFAHSNAQQRGRRRDCDGLRGRWRVQVCQNHAAADSR